MCADGKENLRECVQKQVYNLSFDFEKIDNGEEYGFRKASVESMKTVPVFVHIYNKMKLMKK